MTISSTFQTEAAHSRWAADLPADRLAIGQHIFGNVGVRLTELAQLGAATTADLVTDLERLGYFERRPDPSDRRAKLIFPTRRGLRALRDARNRVAAIERHWAALIGEERFDAACRSLQDILDGLGHEAGSG